MKPKQTKVTRIAELERKLQEALAGQGKDKRHCPRYTLDKVDRQKVFPTDKDVPVYAVHPDGEVAGYIEMFCKQNCLKLN